MRCVAGGKESSWSPSVSLTLVQVRWLRALRACIMATVISSDACCRQPAAPFAPSARKMRFFRLLAVILKLSLSGVLRRAACYKRNGGLVWCERILNMNERTRQTRTPRASPV